MGERKREGVDIWKEREGETGVKMVKTGERDRIFSSVVPFPCESVEREGERETKTTAASGKVIGRLPPVCFSFGSKTSSTKSPHKRKAWSSLCGVHLPQEALFASFLLLPFPFDLHQLVHLSIFIAMESNGISEQKIITGDSGYILQDVPHLTDYIPDLPTYSNPLQDNPAYAVVKQYFVHVDDSVPQKIVVHKDSPRGIHFRRAGPRQKIYFEPDEVRACIVTCGGLCPGLNTVIREIVYSLYHMYGVTRVLGIDGGYKGFYARNTIPLTPKVVNDIHKRGGTILGTSRGGHDTSKIVHSIQDRGINQVYIIGGDGTQKGASVIFEEIRRRGLKVVVAGIPKTIDNDIPVIDRSFGFDTAVEEAQRAINAAHVEAESVENGIGLVKLMGRYSGMLQIIS